MYDPTRLSLNTRMLAVTLVGGLELGSLVGQLLHAQSAGIKRTLLLKTGVLRNLADRGTTRCRGWFRAS
jgi:hypothetical protein